ncbi:MAG: hypothetical protein ACKOA8_14920, partial [Deltaproteobacteria bacterium]
MTQALPPVSLKRKLLLGILFLLLAVIGFLATIPLWFDIDQYRPQIVSMVNAHLNGKLNLGKLSLSCWGKFKIQIESLELEDAAGEKVVSAKTISSEIPLISVLSQSPSLTVFLDKPEIKVVKDKTGKLPLLNLVKVQGTQRDELKSSKTDEKIGATKNSQETAVDPQVEKWAKNSKLSFEMKNAHLVYSDSFAGLQTEIKDLNLEIREFSLSHPGNARVWANVDTKMGKSFAVRGPFELKAKWNLRSEADKGVVGSVEASSDFKLLEIELADGFKKKRGEVGNIKLSLNKTEDTVILQQLELILPQFKINGSASVKDIIADGGSKASIDATLSSEAPGFHMGARAQLTSLTQPRGEVVLTSNGIDLDQLFPQAAISNQAPKSGVNTDGSAIQGSSETQTGQVQSSEIDKSLSSLKDNPYFKNSMIHFITNFKSLKTKGIVISDIESSSKFKSGVFTVNSFKMRLLGGSGTSSGVLNLTGPLPSYQFNSEVSGLQLEQAMASQSELLKNMLKGKAQFQMSGKGESLEPEKAKLRLVAKGSFKVSEARFASLDVGKMATQALGGALVKVVEQVP